MMSFCNSSALTGKLLLCTMEQHKLKLGLPDPLLTHAYRLLGHLATNCLGQTHMVISGRASHLAVGHYIGHSSLLC